MLSTLLSTLILIPLIGILTLFFCSNKNNGLIKLISCFFSLLTFLVSLNLWIFFDTSTAYFQFIEYYEWLLYFKINIFIGLDGISIFFILLTTFLIPVCILTSWENIKKNQKEYYAYFLLIESLLIFVFSSLDIVVFFIVFESLLIPMFLIIGFWGSRTRKIKAGYQFFLYTLVGSVLMLLGIFIVYFEIGSTDYHLITYFEFSGRRQLILWLLFFIAFAIKIPMFPLHIWLPEAHVEAPTAGSIILAGVLLKMGAYGLIRFSLVFFPEGCLYFTPLVFVLSIFAVLYTSMTTLRQIDLKKIIAYSSVAHMGFVTMGIFSLNLLGLQGSLFIMLSHGFISSGLFFCIGILYDRHHTRLIKYYTGLTQVMPLFSTAFLFFSIANLGFPGTSSFVGEFVTLAGGFQTNTTTAFFIAFGMVLGAAYSLWLGNRLLFGKLNYNYILQYKDVSKREFVIILALSFNVIWLGLAPEIVFETFNMSTINSII